MYGRRSCRGAARTHAQPPFPAAGVTPAAKAKPWGRAGGSAGRKARTGFLPPGNGGRGAEQTAGEDEEVLSSRAVWLEPAPRTPARLFSRPASGALPSGGASPQAPDFSRHTGEGRQAPTRLQLSLLGRPRQTGFTSAKERQRGSALPKAASSKSAQGRRGAHHPCAKLSWKMQSQEKQAERKSFYLCKHWEPGSSGGFLQGEGDCQPLGTSIPFANSALSRARDLTSCTPGCVFGSRLGDLPHS